jgi:hypothetical protein
MTKQKPPRPALRWAIYDYDGVLVYVSMNKHKVTMKGERWVRVRVTQVGRRK